MNFCTSSRELQPSVEMSPVWLKHMYSVLCALTWKPMPVAAHSKLCSSVSAWVGVFARITVIIVKSTSISKRSTKWLVTLFYTKLSLKKMHAWFLFNLVIVKVSGVYIMCLKWKNNVLLAKIYICYSTEKIYFWKLKFYFSKKLEL